MLVDFFVDVGGVPGGVSIGTVGDVLPDAEDEESEAEQHEEGDVGEEHELVFEEGVRVHQKDGGQLDLSVLDAQENSQDDPQDDEKDAQDDVPGVALESQHLDGLHQEEDPCSDEGQGSQHKSQISHDLGDYYEGNHVEQPHTSTDPQSNHSHFPPVNSTHLLTELTVLPELVSDSFISGFADSSQTMDSVGSAIRTHQPRTTVVGALDGFSLGRTFCHAIPLLCGVGVGFKIEEGSVFEIIVAEFAGAVGGVVDLVEVIWVGRVVPLLNMQQAMMKRVRAKMAPMMVQQQSVHLRSFSSTGRFRKVYTFFTNMIQQKIIHLFRFQQRTLYLLPCYHSPANYKQTHQRSKQPKKITAIATCSNNANSALGQ